MTDLENIRKKVEKKLKKERWEHTLGVMYTAASLAMCHQEDVEEAMLAGLLHDCAKFCSPKEQIKLCEAYHIPLTKEEVEIPALIHAKLGAYLARKEYRVKEQRILDAILCHTTGKPDMNMLEKILYLADYIEPGRKMLPVLSEVRRLAFEDIDKAVCVCADATLKYLEESSRPVDPMTIKTYRFYKKY